MEKVFGKPADNGFHMPAEFEKQKAAFVIWPHRPGSFGTDRTAACKAFTAIIKAIANDEQIYVITDYKHVNEAIKYLAVKKNNTENDANSKDKSSNRNRLFGNIDLLFSDSESKCSSSVNELESNRPFLEINESLFAQFNFDEAKEKEERARVFNVCKNIDIIICETDDSWARDVCPVFVTNGKEIRGIDFGFNAWGGTANGLYASWDKDNALAEKICQALDIDCYDEKDFILEGGSIHSDGEGTLLTTESCLLSPGRNPQLTKAEIEEKLKETLGVKKVLWLPRGIYNDETDEHVDNVCAFVGPAHVVLAWTDNKEDPQYKLSKACLDYLENETDAKGRKIKVTKLPIPDHPILVDESLLSGYEFEEGEDERDVGERLAASYVNFFFTNDSVVMPVFGGENEESDRRAVEIMRSVAGKRKVIPIPAMAILQGGGNIHCITMQLPDKE